MSKKIRGGFLSCPPQPQHSPCLCSNIICSKFVYYHYCHQICQLPTHLIVEAREASHLRLRLPKFCRTCSRQNKAHHASISMGLHPIDHCGGSFKVEARHDDLFTNLKTEKKTHSLVVLLCKNPENCKTNKLAFAQRKQI